MTQIKLRRDTSAAFASSNPILGNGEPAYETDTKKLKIGDGTTAYTQLEYFSAGGGGGGTTDITATLPLKIVDGVISLEVDGQTIQIVDGKLHANLDELGNEVNDLSGRVTAAEADIANKASKADLDKKENKITTTGALTLTEKIISNLNGMSLTADGAGVYSTSGTSIDNGRSSWRDDDRIIGSSGTSGYFVPGEYTADSWRGGYIDMPYTFGYTMKMPGNASIYGYAGKYDAEGRFIPIIQVGYNHNVKSILYSDSLTLEKESGYDYTILRGQASAASGKTTHVSTSGGRSNSGWTISDKSYQYLQWYIESNGTVTQIQRDGQTTDPRFYVATSASAAIESVARWKEVTVIRFAPTYNYRDKTYGVSANPFPAAEFGVYPTDKKIYEYASEADLIATGNLFDLSGQTAHNYLELNIGSGLAITDGKLHANLDDRQDKFETQVPLSISSSSISTSVDTDITETSESWTGGGSDKLVTVNVSALNIDANSDWKIHLSGYMGNYKSTDTNTNALLISAEKNTIFRVWFGSWDFRLGNQTQTFKRIPSSNTEFFYEIVHQKNGTEFIFNGTNLVDSSPLPISTMSGALGSGTYTTLAGQGKLKDFSFLINSYQFQRIDRDISKSYFEADGVKYRFTSVEGTNTLNLNIGDGLSVVDGKLTSTGLTELPIASATALGGIKVGDNLSITEDGTLSATGGGSAPTNMVTTDTAQTITGIKTFEDKIVFNKPEDDAAEQSSIFGGEFKLGTSKYNNSIYANQLLLNANTTNAGTFKVQTFPTHFTQINGATITSQRTGTGAYKIINTIRPSGDSSNKNYSVLYSEVDDSYNHKLTINNLSSDLVLAGKTIKDGSGNEFITGSNFITFCQNNADAIKAALGIQ